MPVNNMATTAWSQTGGQIHTTDINFAPRSTFVIAALAGTMGGGSQYAGIVSVRSRPEVDGQEVTETFGNWWEWRASVFRQRMSSVTLGVATGKDQNAKAVFTRYEF